MPRKKKPVLVVSINSVKCDGTYYPPEEEWHCPAEHVGKLVEDGAVEVVRVVREAKEPPKTPAGKGSKKTTTKPPAGKGAKDNPPSAVGTDGSDEDNAADQE